MPPKRIVQNSKPDLFKQIYLYLFLSLGLITFSVGLFFLSQNLVKRYLLPKYPLQSFEETRCDYINPPYPLEIQPVPTDLESPTVVKNGKTDEAEKQKKDCLAKLEVERRVRMTTDLSNSLTLMAIGGLIFLSHLWFSLKIKK